MLLNNENEIIEYAKNFAKDLKGGEIICLSGNLGAGKTTFMKGAAEFFNINRNDIISPTFVIANILKAKKENSSIKNIIHIDAYRIENEDNMLETGVLEFFNMKDSIIFIEWPEKIKKFIPENSINIQIEILENNKRELHIL